MTSTELIDAAEKDYKMLKECGRQGEKVMHYNGFLDGSAYGWAEAKKYYIDKAMEWAEQQNFSASVQLDLRRFLEE